MTLKEIPSIIDLHNFWTRVSVTYMPHLCSQCGICTSYQSFIVVLHCSDYQKMDNVWQKIWVLDKRYKAASHIS